MRRLCLIIFSLLLAACATPGPESAPAKAVSEEPAQPVAASESSKTPAKEARPARKDKSSRASKTDTPAPTATNPFTKLKVGMTLLEVEKLIGRPTRQSTHATDKASKPFYFGPDRWVIVYSYKGAGVLTFNSGGEQLLTNIEPNKSE